MILLKEKCKLLKYVSIGSSKDLIYFIAKHIKTPTDILRRGAFFAQLYDELYHELVCKKIKLQKKIQRILEFLALPHQGHNPKQLLLYCEQIRKIRKQIYKEALKKKIRGCRA